MAIFPVYYFPPVSWFAAFLSEPERTLEVKQHYQKQELLSRTRICSANRILPLVIPVEREKTHVPLENSKVAWPDDWQKLHWKSIESAYRSSPFFEYYENRLQPLFAYRPEKLVDHNLRCLQVVLDILETDANFSLSEKYEKPGFYPRDYRGKFDAGGENLPHFFNPEPYVQVFGDFSPDLSILDLLFNLGPEAPDYLLRNFKKWE